MIFGFALTYRTLSFSMEIFTGLYGFKFCGFLGHLEADICCVIKWG